MKKILSWTMVLILIITIIAVFALCGCKPEQTVVEKTVKKEITEEIAEDKSVASDVIEEWTSVAQYKKEPPYKIGWSINYIGISWRTEYVAEFEQQIKKYGDLIEDYIILNAESDVNKQIADIENLVSMNCDAIIVTPQSPTGLAPIIEEVYKSGIPIIVTTEIVETDQLTSYTGIEHYDFGVVGGKWLVEAMGGKGNVVMLDGMAGTGAAVERYRGAMSVIETYPDIKEVSHEYADWAYDKAKTAMQNILTAHSQIDGIWSCGGEMTLAAIDACLEADRELFPMTGEALNGFMKKWIELKEDGVEFKSIAPYMPTWLSAAALNLVMEVLHGYPVPKYKIFPVPTFTEDDLNTMTRQDLPDSYWLGSLLTDDIIQEIFAGQ